jgi:hypothetical protein
MLKLNKMNTLHQAPPIAETDHSQGETVVLPGQTLEGEYILSVLLKRTYDIVRDKVCIRANFDQALIPGDVPWGNPMNTTTRYETDFIPFKLGTDLVFNGTAYAPGGTPVEYFTAAVKIGDRQKRIRIFGDRTVKFVKDGTPIISDPSPIATIALRYEHAYGGIDVYSDRQTAYPYPRNPLGRGFIVENTKDGIDNLELPNIEDPDNLLSAERLCIQNYSNWKNQPMPAGLGWFPKYFQPRSEFAGIMPADRKVEQELRNAYAALLPSEHRDIYLNNGIRDMDFRFFNGASSNLVMPYLKGNEEIATANLGPEGIVTFQLPGDTPEIGLDIGDGVKTTETVIHTVMIHMEERQVDIVWRAAIPYKGPDWLVEMRKMETVIR